MNRPMAMLAVWSTLAVAGAVAAGAYLYAALGGEGVNDIDFGGWQVTVVQAGVVAVGLLVCAGCLAPAVRASRAHPGIGYLVVLPSALAGALVGGAAPAAASPLVGWASHHTHAAAQATRDRVAAQVRYRQEPPMGHTGVPADPALVPHLLEAIDLGVGWYPLNDPNPRSAGPAKGATAAAQSWLHLDHVTGDSWQTDSFLTDAVQVFPTVLAAQSYARSITPSPSQSCGCQVTLDAVQHLNGTPVHVIDQATDISASRTAIFRRGTTVIRVRFNTFMDGHHLTAAESDRILQLAVAKAVR